MEHVIDIGKWILGSMICLGVFFGGAGYLVSKYKGGSSEEKAESADLISSNDQIKQFYKDQNDDLKTINQALSDKIEVLTREVGEIRGQLNAERKQKEEYYAILQNRDPETKKFMEYVIEACNTQAQVNKEVLEVLNKLHTLANDEQNRDLKVTATVTKDPH